MENMKVSRKLLISNVVFSSGGLLVTQLINLFILPLFIKNIGAELYGLWVISGLLLGYLSSFDFGLAAGIQRYIADAYVKEHKEEFNRTASSGIGLLLILGIVFGVTIFCLTGPLLDVFNVTDAYRNDGRMILILTGIASILIWPLRIGSNILQGTLYIKQLSIAGAIHQIVSSLVMLLMVLFVPDVVWVLAVSLFIRLVFRITTVLLARHYIAWMSLSLSLFCWKKIGEMSGFSLNIFCFNLMGMLSSQMHPIFISAILSPAHVVYYTVATKIYQLINRYTSLLNHTVLPTVFNLSAASDSRRVEMLVERGVRYRAILAAPMAMVCLAASPAFIQLWMGDEYVPVALYSQLLAAVILITPLAIAQHVARGCGRPGPINIIFAFRTVVNVGITVILLPKVGAGAAVLGILVSQLVLGEAVFFPFYCRLCGIKARAIFGAYIRIVLVVLPFGIAGFLGAHLLPLNGWGTFLSYCGLLVLLQYTTLVALFFSKTERMDLMLALESVGLGKFVERFKVKANG